MRLSHPDYIKLVKQTYKEKRANNKLSPLLAQSTPAKIRQACSHLYKEHDDKKEHQLLKKDEQALRAFFGPAEPGRKFLELIQNFETDKFRPLDNYLKENTENTDNTNLELLAWLIDFQHRPYSYDKNFQLTDEELYFLENNKTKDSESIAVNNGLKEKEKVYTAPFEQETGDVAVPIEKNLAVPLITDSTNYKTKKKSKQAIVIFLILIVCTTGIYALWRKNANNVCVYWCNDHYEQVSCNEDPHGRIIITMNLEKVRRFRRINRKDTITEWSVGKIYYIKDSNIIKLYNESGSYPEDLKRPLKVLSRYMFENYLNKRDTSGRDTSQLKK